MPVKRTIPRICEHCHKPFMTTKNAVKRGQGRFCSLRCAVHSRHEPAEKRIWKHIEKTAGCWLWTAYRNRDGYGTVSTFNKGVLAHRFVYELLVGPIPDGLEIDHLCRNRACVNPDHLEAVTRAENIARSESISALNAAKTHCIHGHPFSAENTRIVSHDGSRCCRTCDAERAREYRRRNLGAES